MMRKVRAAFEGSVVVEVFGAALLYLGAVAALMYPVLQAASF